MIHSACIKNTLTKCKTLIGHQKLLEVSMFTPADTISIPTSRLKENIPDIAAITGNTLWGFSLLLSKTALNYAPTSILLSMRFIIAFLLMNLILLFKIERISLKGKNILPVLLLALNDVAYFYCESYGIALTNSMFTGVVLSLIPILAMGLSALFLKEFPTLRQILFSFLPVAGVVIIILAGSSSGAIQPVGILFVLSACFLSATQRVINRKAAVNFSAFERSGSGTAVGQSKGFCRGSRYKSISFFTVKRITISDDIMTMALNAFFLAANCVIIIAAHNFSAQ